MIMMCFQHLELAVNFIKDHAIIVVRECWSRIMQLKLFGNVMYQVQKHRDYRQKIILNYQV